MKMEKLRKYIFVSIIALICVVISETYAQLPRSNRRKSNDLQPNRDPVIKINKNPNNGSAPENLKQKRPGSGQRRRMKGSHQRQDHDLRQLPDSTYPLQRLAESVPNGGLFPKPFNIALKAKITANATCGVDVEEFCRMADIYSPRQQSRCELCDASDPELSHPITNAIDGSHSWWQSPSLAQGKEYEFVTIDIDLKQVYEIFLFKLKSAESAIPKAWILERSIDGSHFEPWQFFAADDDDCMLRYNLSGRNANYIFKNDKEVICSTEFSETSKLKYGETKFVLNQRPIDSFTPELVNFTLARFIRVRLQGMLKNVSEIENERSMKWQPDDDDLQKRSYYSIQLIIAQGRCHCHGHAGKCREQIDENDKSASKYPQCECMHNTCGKNCEKCCPLYNQKPFRVGTPQKENRCEKCQCFGHADECRYSSDIDKRSLSLNIRGKMIGGGVCVNCTKFTTGINCEKCLPEYYRPFDREPDHETPCVPCDCTEKGSVGTCNPIGGECVCKPGYSGAKCDQCAIGFNGSDCNKCSCDIRGTIPGGECDDKCQCKTFVTGDKCDKCVDGYFGLSAKNTDGCMKCFCSGIGATCESQHVERRVVETLEGWSVTDISKTQVAYPAQDNETGLWVFGMYELADVEAVYWSAPPVYLGNRLENYGSHFLFQMDWVIVRGDTSGKPTSGPNFILIGKNGMKIASGDGTFKTSNASVDISLTEDGWYHVPKTVKDIITRLRRTEYRGDPVTRTQFMSVLTNLDSIMIRGTYHTDQAEGILKRATLYSGDINRSNDILEHDAIQEFSAVEKCQCPPGYTGLSCEECTFGHIKIHDNSTTHEKIFRCSPCNCNGHSNTCDVVNNECGECEHNTIGERCESCKEGFYGDATNGSANDCKKCACPLIDEANNFSPSCEMKDSSDTSDYVCKNCSVGHVGDHCERCEDGFYGTPTEPGSRCLPCPCNGDPCDAVTGKCFKCEGNTEGWRCEKCKKGFFGDPKVGCEMCECSDSGAINNLCDPIDGKCNCKSNYVGQLCDQCAVGHANVSLFCPPCECNKSGSADENCDPINGQCLCKSNVIGLRCDTCDELYFGLSDDVDGCEGCNCHISGSEDRVCDQRSGQCKCRPHVIGRTCDLCESGYWNIDSKKGCSQCSCNLNGSRDHSCDVHTGQCSCKAGVEGVSCDRCRFGYYGFSSNGCKQCNICDSSAKICDQESGRCVCPPLSHGSECQHCYPNAWGFEYLKGCKNCDCNLMGSLKQSCDGRTGQCVCKEGYTGRSCDNCAIGYFGYPNCQKCNCDLRGSKNLPGYDAIDCDDHGQCPCKELTTGLKCDECRQSTFGLSESNPSGCTRCFCFGRSQDCSQNPLIWGQTRLMGPRNVTVHYIREYDTLRNDVEHVIVSHIRNNQVYRENAEIKRYNGLMVFPSYSGNVTIGSQTAFYHPFYFQLPKEFLGDKTNSYGGYLNFSISSVGCSSNLNNDTLNAMPLVQMHTHHHLILNYYHPEILNSSVPSQTYNVVLHESLWRYESSGYNISRAIMMTALQNIKHIFLRATTSPDFTQVVLDNVTMHNGMPVNGNNNAAIASGVEKCECPEMYSGDSCQDPAEGYYRWRNTTTKTSLLEDLVGRVIPCECNGRSSTCDKETGECLNCLDNTGGKHCETCAEGYYGHPDESCEPCPCPETNKNFARGCYVSKSSVACYCKEGYTGPLCDRCSKGFFGYPQNKNGFCESCDCNIEGIVSDECDELTGQCNCKRGVTGRRCDKCELPRHLLVDYECQLCDNCTQTLLDTVDEIMYKFEVNMEDVSLHNLKAPWIKLYSLSNDTDFLSAQFDEYFDAVDAVDNFNDIATDELLTKAESVHTRASKIIGYSEKKLQKSEKMKIDTESILMDVRDITGIVQETIINLENYGSNDHHIKLPNALKEAQMNLDDIRRRSQNIPKSQESLKCANDQFDFWSDELNAITQQQQKLDNYLTLRKLFNERLDDLKNLTHRTFRDSSETEAFVTKNRKSFEKLKQKSNSINEETEELEKLISFGIIAESDTLMEILNDAIGKSQVDNRDLIDLNVQIKEVITERENEMKDIKETLLPKAKKHAEDLAKRSKVIVDTFQNSKDGARVAMLAGTAHKNITEAINAARDAAEKAHDAAVFSNDKLDPIDPEEETMIEKGQDLSLESEAIQTDAESQITKIKGLKEMLDYQETIVKNMSNQIRNSGKTNNEMSALITKLSNSETRKTVQESAIIADEILEDMNVIEKETLDINNDVVKLNKKLLELDPEWDSKFGLAEENVTKTLSNIREANNTWNFNEPALRQQNEKFQKWNASFSLKLQELRDKIAQAKHAAEGIRVSVESSESNCVRSYFPTSVGPSTSNSIVMTIALNSKKTDSPLLFLQGEDQKFIALEMINRKIYLLWNLGADTGVLMHPMEIQTRDPKYDDAWYKIEITRNLNIGSLTVQRMNNDGNFGNSNIVTGATSQEFTRLTIDHLSRVYMGGVPDDHLKPAEMKSSNGLSVIVHQLFIDHLQVGLWHFSSSEGKCEGAMLGATETSDSSRHFNGQGYSVVRSFSSRAYPKKVFSLQITFRTFDENALLFLTVDEKYNRSISLTLHEGKLVFRIDYGGESQLEINTTSRYNTGEWVNVEAAREFTPKRSTENGSLKVDNEEPQTGSPTKPVNAALLPDVSKAPFYLGGVPPGFKSGTTKAPGADYTFFGCLRDVQINGEMFDPLDSQSYFGVEPSCKEVIGMAGFSGNGYVELPSHSLRKRANFGFVFRTLQTDCLLLLSGYPPQTKADYDSKDVRGNFSVSLVNGHIHVWVDAGKGRVELESNLTLNDGEFHVVNVNKVGRKFELRINDDLQATKMFSATPALVNSPEDIGGLFFGGAPDFPEFDNLAPTSTGLEGAIKDVVFNNKTISFDQVVSFKNVHMGGSGPVMGIGSSMLMKSEPMGKKFKETTEGCQRVGSYSYEPNAFKFGNGQFSFSMLQIPSRNLWHRNFNIQFDFRTFYPDGFLFASPDSREKPKHYAYLFLRNGNLVFVIRGRKREEIYLPVKINDGLWHHVTLDSKNRVVTLSISRNGKTPSTTISQAKVKLPKKFFVSNLLFIGGLPQKPPKFHKEVISKKEDFRGCIRRFSVNSITQDLARKYNNLGQCFPRVEKGSYFSGDAYAEYKKEFNVGKHLEIEMEFKSSELSGILLGIAEPPFGSPSLSIEVYNGKVIMSCDLGDREPFRAETKFASKFSLCDNKWHNISALYDTHQVAIRIDDQPFVVAYASSRNIGKLQTKSTLYIGGIPESAQSQTIMMRENFKGCIRNVKLNSGSNGMGIVDWTDMDNLHNVLLNECPSGSK